MELRISFTRTASSEDHLRTWAAFQQHPDNAASKTITPKETAAVDHVLEALRRAFALWGKRSIVYRQGTKCGQVLTRVGDQAACPECRGALEFSEDTTLCRVGGFSGTL